MAGDAVLVALAEKMQQMCQETDIVMRLGGDEFAMYLRGVHTRAEAEGHKIYVYPMDYEEFLWATGGNPNVIDMAYKANMEMGNTANRNAMRDFRIYMAVGGMPQAVESYIETNSFESVDKVKREILDLYYDDLKKNDTSGRITDMYKSVPSQLAGKKKHYVIAAATGKQKTRKDEERLFELIDSGLVLPCYNVTNPGVSLSQTKEIDCFKLYLSDIGLFTTMLFNDSENGISDIYRKLLSDRLPADLGFLYENVVAQMIKASGRDLYYHTWRKKDSTHSYEIDFLLTSKNKVIPVEVKSSAVKNHESIDQFEEKYSGQIGDRYLLSQKDVGKVGTLKLKPIYIWHLFCTRISKSNERPALRKTQSRVLFFMCNFNYTVNDNWV